MSSNIDLVLSGHTYGEQIRFPFIGGLIAPDHGLFPKYNTEEYSPNNTIMMVSEVSEIVFIPVRWNNRPEIVIVELFCNQ